MHFGFSDCCGDVVCCKGELPAGGFLVEHSGTYTETFPSGFCPNPISCEQTLGTFTVDDLITQGNNCRWTYQYNGTDGSTYLITFDILNVSGSRYVRIEFFGTQGGFCGFSLMASYRIEIDTSCDSWTDWIEVPDHPSPSTGAICRASDDYVCRFKLA